MNIDGNQSKPDNPNENAASDSGSGKVARIPGASGGPLPPTGTGRAPTPAEMAAAHQARPDTRTRSADTGPRSRDASAQAQGIGPARGAAASAPGGTRGYTDAHRMGEGQAGGRDRHDRPHESAASAADSRRVARLPGVNGGPLPPTGTGRAPTPAEMAAAHQAKLEARAAGGAAGSADISARSRGGGAEGSPGVPGTPGNGQGRDQVTGTSPGTAPGEVPGPGARAPRPGGEGVTGADGVTSQLNPEVGVEPDSGTGVDASAGTAVIDGNGDPDVAAGGQRREGLLGALGRALTGTDVSANADTADAGAGTSGDQGGEDGNRRAAPGSRTAAEGAQPGQQVSADGKSPEKRGEVGEEDKSKDQPAVPNPAADAAARNESGRPGDQRPGDQQGDRSAEARDENADAVAAAEQRMLAAIEKMRTDYDAKLDAQKAQHQQEMDQLREQLKDEFADQLKAERAEHKAEIESLKDNDKAAGDRLNQVEAKLEPKPDGEADGKDPDQVKAAQRRSDRPPQGTGDPDAGADAADILGSAPDERVLAERETPKRTERRWFTLDNAKGLSGLVGYGATIAGLFMHVPPELAVATGAITAYGGVKGSTIVQNILNRRKGSN